MFVVVNFLKNRTIIGIERKLSPVFQHGFLRSEENVVLYKFDIPDGVWENIISSNIWTLMVFLNILRADVMPQCYVGRCFALADVIAIYYVVDVIITEEDVISSCLFYKWQVLLPFNVVEDVEPHALHVATCYLWQMLLPVAVGTSTTGWF